jgi:hypothetical protein
MLADDRLQGTEMSRPRGYPVGSAFQEYSGVSGA